MPTKESIKSISRLLQSVILSLSLVAVNGIDCRVRLWQYKESKRNHSNDMPYTRLLNYSHVTASPTPFQHVDVSNRCCTRWGRGGEMRCHLLLLRGYCGCKKGKKLNIFQYIFAPTLPPVVNSLTLKMLEKSVFEIFSPCLPSS